MHSLQYLEAKQRGTMDFPLDYHFVSSTHTRYEMPYHWHEETEILFVLSGRFSLFLDGERFELDTGDVAYIASGSLHAGVPQDCVYECIVFDLRILLNIPGTCRELIGEVNSRKIRIQPCFRHNSTIAKETVQLLFQGFRQNRKGGELIALDTVDNSQINVLAQRTMHRICTAATNEEVSFAYRVAIPRQRFGWRNAFSTRWRSL